MFCGGDDAMDLATLLHLEATLVRGGVEVVVFSSGYPTVTPGHVVDSATPYAVSAACPAIGWMEGDNGFLKVYLECMSQNMRLLPAIMASGSRRQTPQNRARTHIRSRTA